MPGEWLQQGGVLRRSGERRGLRLPWPKKLRGYWLQGGAFLAIGLFSAVTLTDPRVTAWVLLGLILLAVALSLVFERRAFCSYVCPIGGFTGLYAQAAPLELRVKDNAICKTHSLAIGHSDQPPVDVNPGEISEVTLTFDRPGKYTFYCTRWCSINHWRMRGVIEVTDAPGASTGSLVYDNGFPPASVVAHGHDGQTWITLVDSPQQGIHTSLGAAIQDAIG